MKAKISAMKWASAQLSYYEAECEYKTEVLNIPVTDLDKKYIRALRNLAISGDKLKYDFDYAMIFDLHVNASNRLAEMEQRANDLRRIMQAE